MNSIKEKLCLLKKKETISIQPPPKIVNEENAISVLPGKFTLKTASSEHNIILKNDTSSSFTTSTGNFRHKLAQWAVNNHVSHSSFNELLSIIKKQRTMQEFLNLPSDCRTILKTNCETKYTKTLSGHYHHFGIANSLQYILGSSRISIRSVKCLQLDINVDGLPLTKSSQSQFWPIMGCVSNIEDLESFIIGIFHGNSKQASSSKLLDEFIREFLLLKETGIRYQNQILQIHLSKFICEAPAKAFVLCIKGHNSYFGCTKCIVEGECYNRRMCYEQLDCTKRCDEYFKNNMYDDFQMSPTPLLTLDIGLSNFPLDSMHLIYLEVMKRLLVFWSKGNLAVRMTQIDF